MVRKILHIVGIAALMASCSDTWVYTPEESPYLNGEEKTPIQVTALLDAGTASAKTRAADKKFADRDKFVAYLRHVTWDGSTGERTLVSIDKSPKLVTFTKGDAAMEEYDGTEITPIGTNAALGLTSSNTKKTSDFTADPLLYWDDFSSSDNAEHDLRTQGHYLQSYYGYCYNGGIPTTALNESDGTLGWTVSQDQSSGIKTSDLLWSYEQRPVGYSHETTRTGLVLPYTHAMSKVTIEVVCSDGFDSSNSNFSGASVKLKNMQTVANLTAPTGTITAVSGDGDSNVKDVTTLPIPHASNPNTRYSFAALIAPTMMKNDQVLAEIKGIDGNNYTLKLTDAILNTTAENDWASKLIDYNSSTGGTTMPGVNYFITATIKKQGITIQALIKDWEEVSAEGVGTIQFANDVKTIEGATGSAFTGSFDAYLMKDGESGYTKSSVVTWDDEHSKWDYATTLYWPNATDQFKFRALSPTGSNANALTSGTEVLWGTTAAHNGKDISDADYSYGEGVLIKPRTKDIPLVFYHPMSKITINLENKYSESDVPAPLIGHDGAPLSPLNPLVDLSGATIQISNLRTTGTIALEDGAITATGVAGNLFTAVQYAGNETDGEKTNRVKGSIVIPQDILGAAIITITLADGTTYKAQLNKCQYDTGEVDGEGNPIYNDLAVWQRGKHYTYTITLEKEKITFRALIQEWEEKTGSGNATLEWD